MTTKDMKQLAWEISEKKRYLSEHVATPISDISNECLYLLDDEKRLDSFLQQAIGQLPYCNAIYVTDRRYRQLSSSVMKDRIDSVSRGKDLSQRPYLQATIPLKGLVLSNSYQDRRTSRSCITLVQAIQQDGQLQGLVIADFNLDDLPIPNTITRLMSNWHQFKGDPAIRGALFSQQRVSSQLDIHIDQIHEIMRKLVTRYGVFHVKLHYSSSRVTLWFYDHPHDYRLHDVDDLLNGTVFDHYPERTYPDNACVNSQLLEPVFLQFMALRFADENIYLRSGSVNIINGMVGLTFSCDGSHYIPAQEFIDNSMDYWLGTLKTA